MKKQLLITAAFALMSAPAMASDFYILADAGQIKYEADSQSESDTGFSLGGGYKFSDMFAVEFAYRDLGEIKERYYEDLGGGDSYEENFKNELSAVQVSLLGSLSLGQSTSIYGRLGYADIDLDYSFSDVEVEDGEVTSSSSGSGTLSKNKVLLGVGFAYSLSEAFALRAEYGQYGKFEEIKISSLTVGLTYQF